MKLKNVDSANGLAQKIVSLAQLKAMLSTDYPGTSKTVWFSLNNITRVQIPPENHVLQHLDNNELLPCSFCQLG